MKLLLLVVLVTYFLLPITALAQSWTEQEQELLDHIAICWDAWLEGLEKNKPEIWVEKCNTNEKYSMWWTDQGAPEGLDVIKRNFETFRTIDLDWIDIRPVAIKVFDNVGIVQFYGYWKAKTEDGSVTTEYKRTEVFLKVDGKWSFLGGQGTPVTSADADPYK